MIKILWVCYQDLSDEQKESLSRIYGKSFEIKKINTSKTDITTILDASKDCDVLAFSLVPACIYELFSILKGIKPILFERKIYITDICGKVEVLHSGWKAIKDILFIEQDII